MKEIKRMLEAIHVENKSILLLLCSLLCSEECKTVNEVIEVSDEIDGLYDKLFYGKESDESING